MKTVTTLKKSAETPPVKGSRISIIAGKTSSLSGKKSTPRTKETYKPTKEAYKTPKENIISELEKQPGIDELDEIGEFTPLKDLEIEIEQEFIFPTRVGIPTINPTMKKKDTVHIRGKYYVEVLSGRTYIAR